MLVVCIFASALGALIMCLLVLRDGFAPTTSESGPTERDVLISRLGHAAAGVCFATTAIVATVLLARTPAPRVMAAPDPQISVRLAALDRDRERLGEQIRALGSAVQTLRDEVGSMGGGVQGMRARLDAAESRVAQAEAAVTKAEAAVAKTDAAMKRVADDVEKATARGRQVERPVPAKPAAVVARETAVVAPAPREIAAAPPARRPSTEAERSPESASTPGPETAVAPVAPAPAPVATPPPPKPAAAPAPSAAVAAAPKPAAPPKAVTATAPKTPPAPAASAAHESSNTGLTDKVRKDWDTIRKGLSTAGDDISAGFRQLGRRLTGRD